MTKFKLALELEREQETNFLTSKWLRKRKKPENMVTSFCFIDYSNSFDRVSHGVLWNGMANVGFLKHIIDSIKSVYIEQKATVRATHGLTDWLTVEQGVRQDRIFSPSLFSIN